jgi:hypothetical protein
MRHHALALAVALALPAAAQERPAEESLFGEEPTPAPDSPGSRDDEALSGAPAANAFETQEAVDDPLKIGGRFYLRALAIGRRGFGPEASGLSTPTLIDGYFDARPSERIRGYVLGRLLYDAAVPASDTNSLALVSGDPPSARAASSPSVVLDQAWLRFDLDRKVFFTVGRQHVRWGTARFWNPTDFITPDRRNALSLIDARVGASLIKVHVPWEERNWNFYALALIDNAGPARALGGVGAATRAEVVLGNTELGAEAVFQFGRRNRFGFDLSSAVGPLDVYAEVAFTRGTEGSRPLYRLPQGVSSLAELIERTLDPIDPDNPGAERLANLSRLEVETYVLRGLNPQVTGGATWTFAYNENDTATVGVEYFYNGFGYDSPELYPVLIARGEFQSFFVGRHYAGLYALLNGPGSWDNTSFILSNLGNLSDRSFVARLDVVHRALSFLQVEANASVFYGRRGGEFRLSFDIPASRLNGQRVPSVSVPAPTFQLGAGLRIDL